MRLLSFALRMLGERPDLQSSCATTASASRTSSRRRCGSRARCGRSSAWPRVDTDLAGVDIPAGGTVMLVPGACNRDPRVFERPHEFDIDRPNARQHIGFGHGIHTCAGAPLARAEGRVTLNRFLDRTGDIRISEEHHGPAGRPPLRVPADLLPARPAAPPPRPRLTVGRRKSAGAFALPDGLRHDADDPRQCPDRPLLVDLPVAHQALEGGDAPDHVQGGGRLRRPQREPSASGSPPHGRRQVRLGLVTGGYGASSGASRRRSPRPVKR